MCVCVCVCEIWEGKRAPLVNWVEITWWVFLAGTQECDAGPRSGVGTTSPQKCASNYSMDVAGWTQAFYRLLVEGMLTNSSRGGLLSKGGLADAAGQIGREGREEVRW